MKPTPEMHRMEIIGLYAALYVRDLKAAVAFYTKLIGREPDDRPNDKLVQWRGFGTAGIQLFADSAKAGHGVMTLVVPDLDVVTTRLARSGVVSDDVLTGDFGKIAHIADADGNTVTLAEPPKKA
jgi:predicted enzyme related to lactoylglutathione lyase